MAKLGDICTNQSSNIKQGDLEPLNGEYPIYGASGFIKNVDFYKQDKPYVAIVKDGAGIGRVMQLPAFSSIIGTMQYIIPNDDTDVKYLAYAMEHMNLSKYFTGATIPHIYFKDYKNEPIIAHDFETQRQIADNLDRVTHTIDLCNAILEKLDLLVKSRFVEMFFEKGYPVLMWNDVFNTKTGKLDSNAMVEDGEYPFFTCSKEVLRIDQYAFDQEALLLAGNNAAGKYDVKYYKGKFNAYQRTYVLGLKQAWSYRLFQYQLEDKLVYLQQQSLGGLTKYLTMKILGELSFIIPPMDKQSEFESFVSQTDKSKLAVKQVLEKAETLKKALMQEYFG